MDDQVAENNSPPLRTKADSKIPTIKIEILVKYVKWKDCTLPTFAYGAETATIIGDEGGLRDLKRVHLPWTMEINQ